VPETDDEPVSPITITVNPGDASRETIRDLFLALSAAYEAQGGSGLKIVTKDTVPETEKCECGKNMILRSTGIVWLTYPRQYPQEWWCGGCDRTKPGPTRRGKTREQIEHAAWAAANK